MMQKYTNMTNLPLSLAVYLATDHYDHAAVGDGISATTLLKPIKQVILGKRVSGVEGIPDVAGMISSRLGTSIHTGIKHAWMVNYEQGLRDLGYPEAIIAKVVINPPEGTDLTGKIPVYLEVRTSRIIDGVKISGEFDFLGEGMLEDHKSTSVYSYIFDSKDEDYILQGSIYRWLNPKIVTSDVMGINFIFMDWSSFAYKQQPAKYPPSRMLQRRFKLLSLATTEGYIKERVALLLKLWDAPEELLPPCNDKDLWRSEAKYKFFLKPETAAVGGKATKNFDTYAEAAAHQASVGKGVVKTFPGEVKACKHCPGFAGCKQKDELIASGDLIM